MIPCFLFGFYIKDSSIPRFHDSVGFQDSALYPLPQVLNGYTMRVQRLLKCYSMGQRDNQKKVLEGAQPPDHKSRRDIDPLIKLGREEEAQAHFRQARPFVGRVRAFQKELGPFQPPSGSVTIKFLLKALAKSRATKRILDFWVLIDLGGLFQILMYSTEDLQLLFKALRYPHISSRNHQIYWSLLGCQILGFDVHFFSQFSWIFEDPHGSQNLSCPFSCLSYTD